MAVQNPSFEDAGPLPGEAAHWTITAVTSLEVLAGFGSQPEVGQEDFERWFPFVNHFDKLTVSRAFFGSTRVGLESFDAEWFSEVFSWALQPAQLAFAQLGTGNQEHFQGGWSTDSFAHHWSQVDAVAAGRAGFETFERGWQGNDAFALEWSDVASEAAKFNGGMVVAETFEATWAAAATM